MSINEIAGIAAPKKGGMLEKFVMHGLEQSQPPVKTALNKFRWGVMVDGKMVENHAVRGDATARAGVLGGVVKRIPIIKPSGGGDNLPEEGFE